MATELGQQPKAKVWRLLARLGLGVAGLAALTVGLYYGSTAESPRPVVTSPSLIVNSSGGGIASGASAIATNPVRPSNTNDTAQSIATSLVGDKTCAECHPGEAAYYSGSGHANTLRPAAITAVAKWLHGRKVTDPEHPEVTWTYALHGDRLEVERAEGDQFHCFALEHALGSGTNGMTFVSTFPQKLPGHGETGLEHRISYFSNGPTMNISPGQGEARGAESEPESPPMSQAESEVKPKKNLAGKVLDEVLLDQCFKCHSTVTNATGEARVDMAVLRPNVGCERCHGPGKAHVEAARRNAKASELVLPHGLGETSAVLQINLCGECHRRLDNVRQSQINPKNAQIARFQPVGLQLSACFQNGETGLKCTSCHDPHAKVKHDAKAYESVCLGCHNPLKKSVCPVSDGTGCIDCHMPKRAVTSEVSFHDHWIHVPYDKATGAR